MPTHTPRPAVLAATLLFGAALAAAAAADITTNAPRPDYRATIEDLRSFVREQMDRRKVPGLSIALFDDQAIIWAEGFGYADLAARRPATADTVYRAGSISKLFTVAAALQLAEQKRLDIDRPLVEILPEFSIKTRFPEAPAITPRHLMTHHAGLPRQYLQGSMSDQPFDDLVHALKTEYLAYPPGHMFAYSNLGITLLGIGVESVSGQPFAAHMQRALFAPLGMTHSDFSTLPRHPQLATPYENGSEAPLRPLRDVPAGGLNASASDLARFGQMVLAEGRLNGQRLLRRDSVRAMLTPQNDGVPLDVDTRIGLGWFLDAAGLKGVGPVASHSGGVTGFRSTITLLPEHKLGVAVLANSGQGGAVRDVATESLRRALQARTGRPAAVPAPTPPEPPVIRLTEAEGQAMSGLYYTPEMGFAEVAHREGRLFARILGKRLELTPHADGRYSVTYLLWGFIPVKKFLNNDLRGVAFSRAQLAGHDVLLLHERDRTRIYGERLEPTTTPAAWQVRVGALELLDPPPDVELRDLRIALDHGYPVLRYSIKDRPTMVVLLPVNDSEAVTLGLGSGYRETVRIERHNGEEQLISSGLRFRWRPAAKR